MFLQDCLHTRLCLFCYFLCKWPKFLVTLLGQFCISAFLVDWQHLVNKFVYYFCITYKQFRVRRYQKLTLTMEETQKHQADLDWTAGLTTHIITKSHSLSCLILSSSVGHVTKSLGLQLKSTESIARKTRGTRRLRLQGKRSLVLVY